MKRLFSVILISAALLGASFTSSAQYFNHLSLGIGAGIDGASLQLGVPVGPLLQIRAGASYMPQFGIPFTVSNVHFDDNTYGDVNLKASMAFKSMNAMLDFFPGKKTRFHLTAGIYYSPAFFGNGAWANAVGTSDALDPEDYGTTGIMIGNTLVTTDEQGRLQGYVATKQLMPYFGLGSGRAVGLNSAVSFLFDLGVCYLGDAGIGAYTYGLNTLTGEKETVRVTSADIDNRDSGILDIASKIPVMPILKFSLFFRLF